MKLELKYSGINNIEENGTAIGIFMNNGEIDRLQSILGVNDNLFLDNLKQLINENIDFNKDTDTAEPMLFQVFSNAGIKKVIVAKINSKNSKYLESEYLRRLITKIFNVARNNKVEQLNLNIFNIFDKIDVNKAVYLAAETLLLAEYKFDKYKTIEKENAAKLTAININMGNIPKTESLDTRFREALCLGKCTIEARKLVNEPANYVTPSILALEAQKFGLESGFEVDIFNKEKIISLNMSAFYAVAKASSEEPKLIVMRYFGDKDNMNDIVGIVGKGLTYDSGGLSLKPTTAMEDMKMDKSGAVAAICIMNAVATMKLNINVIAVIAACENMPSGRAYKPGDIITTMSGKTIEVLNTDAEGRLTLADAVHYITAVEKVTKVIDIATLTGAVVSALGEITTGVVTNNDELYDLLIEASNISGEYFWRLPSSSEYRKLIDSEVADIKNMSKNSGTITAGMFVGEFVQNRPWLHLDIAGTAWSSKESYYYSKGATGAPVRTIYNLLKILALKK